MHWSFLTLAVVLLAAGLLLAAAIIVAMAVSILRPPRMSDGKALWVLRRLSPGDLGLQYETMNFGARDQRTGQRLTIAGWWIPHPEAQGQCLILLHGYADAKVGAIAWAPLWHKLGFNILAIDLRAHGVSDGAFTSAGFSERHDVGQIINELRALYPAQTRQLMLFGASLGAVVALATAAMRDDIAGVVLDSPYVDFRDAARAQMDRLSAPGGLFQTLALRLAERLAGADFDEIRLLELLSKASSPVLAIIPELDPLLPPASRLKIELAIKDRAGRGLPDRLWVVPGCDHLLALHSQPAEYQIQLERFLHSASVIQKAV